MNILHVVPAFAPCFSAGGVVNAAYQIAKKQVEMGNNVCVFTTDSCKERLAMDKHYDVDVDGIKVYYFKNLSNAVKNKLTIDTPLIAYDSYLPYIAYQSYDVKYEDKDVEKMVNSIIETALQERETSRGGTE